MSPMPLVSCRLGSRRANPAAYLHRDERQAVQITIDSNEPLEDALRVLGAMYAVTVTIAENNTAAATQPPRNASAPSSQRVRVRKPSKKLATKRAAKLDNVEIRSWALENGVTVSNRGRLPARVVAAYRDAHQL